MPDPVNDVPLPPYAYVPGRVARHPEGWFDAIRGSVSKDIAPSELHQTAAWRAGLSYLEAGYFWECHEVLEAVWMQAPNPSPEREMVQAIIQLANARLKLRSGSPPAAWRLCDMVETHLSRCPVDKDILGMQVSDLMDETEATRKLAKSRM